MARVIKAGQGAVKSRSQPSALNKGPIGKPGGKKKVIEKEVYKARQEAAKLP